MILPCRNHRTRSHIDSLPLVFLLATFWLIRPNEVIGQYGAGSASETGAGRGYVPLEITTGVDFGYDDHVIGSNAAGNASSPSSFFAKENLVLTYDRPGEQTEFRLLGIGRFTQFFDVGTDDKDVSVTASFTHNFTTRLSFNAEIYGAYQTEPNFQSNIGPTNVRAPHFDTNDIFSLTYRWLPRLSTVTSYTFQRIKYESSSLSSAPSLAAIGAAQDRFQHTLAERVQFSLTRRTSLTGEYRFEIIDYDTAPRDATIHFALAGLDHHLTEHLLINVLGGPSFRFFKNDGSSINPYAQVKIAYQGSNHSLTWITTYGVEQPSQTVAAGATTLRSGLNLTYDLTSRINLKAGAFYHHEENQAERGGTVVNTSTGAQDSLHLTLGLKYTINKHFALHADYEYTNQSSFAGASGFSRNRYFAGVTYTY
jgi:Putative beta-barrel porin 2